VERLRRVTRWFTSHLLQPADRTQQVAAPTA
jgi:hypothetical protein